MRKSKTAQRIEMQLRRESDREIQVLKESGTRNKVPLIRTTPPSHWRVWVAPILAFFGLGE